MKLKNEVYNHDIAHCPGSRRAICARCLRYALFKTWQSLSPSFVETVLMMPPRADNSGCRNEIHIPKGYEKRKKNEASFFCNAFGKLIAN